MAQDERGEECSTSTDQARVVVTTYGVKYYFAFGSNMSRARLETRTSVVVHHGHAVLAGYRHAFSHRGRDRTAKGNIAVAADNQVHGVVYRLTAEQFEILHPYESGYYFIDETVLLKKTGELVVAKSYTSIEITQGIQPNDDYLEHYMNGMRENRLPEHYVDFIRKQAGR